MLGFPVAEGHECRYSAESALERPGPSTSAWNTTRFRNHRRRLDRALQACVESYSQGQYVDGSRWLSQAESGATRCRKRKLTQAEYTLVFSALLEGAVRMSESKKHSRSALLLSLALGIKLRQSLYLNDHHRRQIHSLELDKNQKTLSPSIGSDAAGSQVTLPQACQQSNEASTTPCLEQAKGSVIARSNSRNPAAEQVFRLVDLIQARNL